jgi:hypothetical protein
VREAALADTVRQLRGDSAELAQDLRGARFALRGARLNRDSLREAIEDSVIQNLPPDVRALLAAEERVADEAQAEAAACDASLMNCESRARVNLARFLLAERAVTALTAHNKRQDALIRDLNRALHPGPFAWFARDWQKYAIGAGIFGILQLVAGR